MSRFATIISRFGGAADARSEGAVEAVWGGAVLASSDAAIIVEGNHYFPPDSVNWDVLSASDRRTVCPWKGQARYYNVDVDGERNEAAAWSYADPNPAAAQLKDHVAFWRGIQVRPSGESQS
jgi:uncharacterized protein (DUF427 family)